MPLKLIELLNVFLRFSVAFSFLVINLPFSFRSASLDVEPIYTFRAHM